MPSPHKFGLVSSTQLWFSSTEARYPLSIWKLTPSSHKFSKLGALVHLPYKNTMETTFENALPEFFTGVLIFFCFYCFLYKKHFLLLFFLDKKNTKITVDAREELGKSHDDCKDGQVEKQVVRYRLLK